MHLQGFQQKLQQMAYTANFFDFVPEIIPQKMSGTITYKIRQKTDYKRVDKTSALYLEIYQAKYGRKRMNINISIPVKDFDIKKQRVKYTNKHQKDYNLVIEKLFADINKIEVTYRLLNTELTIDKLIDDLTKPSLRVNFNEFYSQLLEYQKEANLIKITTYKQQRATLSKIKQFKDPWLFSEINKDSFAEFRAFLKIKLKNKPATVEIATKNFKKYLHAANDKDIATDLNFSDISIKDVRGEITYLLPDEVKRLHDFYLSPFCNETWRNILQRYLFSCFTGLRISDIEAIRERNFINDTLVFTSQKTEVLQRIKLNNTARHLIHFPHIFNGTYAQQTINEELKKIAKACNIKKRLYFHSARHTFATNYLISGGQVHNLQRLLGHTKIDTTMKYVHVVNDYMNNEIDNMDDIINSLPIQEKSSLL